MSKAILDNIKKNITPSAAAGKAVEVTVKQINKALKEANINAKCVVGGSFAKSTHLKGDHDVDLFVRFNYSYKNKDISKILARALPYKVNKLPGSRDYFQFTKGNLDYEVVPVLHVDNYKLAKNVTDMSPLHVDYVKNKVKKNKSLNNEIRLAKQFSKACKVYGAESYIQGFSGHVVDLLVLHYGSFMGLIRSSSKWNKTVVIDMEKHWSNPLKQLNKSKLESPLVLIDPLQPNRNAAAAMSADTFELFKRKCKEFLKNPSQDFFKTKRINLNKLKNTKGVLIALQIWPYKGKDDVMGAKLKQIHEYIFTKVQEAEWPILEADWEYVKDKKSNKKKSIDDKAHGVFYYILADKVKPTFERKGPPVSQVSDVKAFNKKHKKTFIRGNRIYATIPRRINVPEELIDNILDQNYVDERGKDIAYLEV